jgi:CRP-like cAMP-binding protein
VQTYGDHGSREKPVIRNHPLIKEGEPAEAIYIIKSGQFQCNKRVLDYRISEAQQDLELLHKDTLK